MRSKYKHYISPLIFLVLILVSFVAMNLLAQIVTRNNRTHYENAVSEEISADMKIRFEEYIDKIESMKDFVDERKDIGIDYNEFYLFASGLFENDESVEDI